MVIPIADEYKSHPYRGQERFPSYLAYVWGERPGLFSGDDFERTSHFPRVPRELWDVDLGLNDADGLKFYMDDDHRGGDDGRISGLSPGLASLANHGHEGVANVKRIEEHSRADYAGMSFPFEAGAGAFTPHHGVDYYASRGVAEGMEILLYYGDAYDVNVERRVRNWIEREDDVAIDADGDVNEDGTRPKRGFEGGVDAKWDDMDWKEMRRCPRELPTEGAKRRNSESGRAFDSSAMRDGERPYSEYRTNDFHPLDTNPMFRERTGEDDARGRERRRQQQQRRQRQRKARRRPTSPDDITRSLPWLGENGVCLNSGRLRVARSSISWAGRGLFASSRIPAGEVILTSPLLAMRRDDFVIYRSDPTRPPTRVLDKSAAMGTELLYNYAFSHPESPLHLVPTAPLANYINHGRRDAGEANVRVRWPGGGSNAARLFSWAYGQPRRSHFAVDYDDFLSSNDGRYVANPFLRDHPIDVMERSGRLGLEYVAMRDIGPDEEILLDYGPLWDAAWTEFANASPYARSSVFRHPIGVPDGLYPPGWLHATDRYEVAELKDLESSPLAPGSVRPLTWAHNGKLLGSKYAYVIGLERGFSDRFLKLSEEIGVVNLYRNLLTEQEGYRLESDSFRVYPIGTNHTWSQEEQSHRPDQEMEVFAHRYKSKQWNFNMHFVSSVSGRLL